MFLEYTHGKTHQTSIQHQRKIRHAASGQRTYNLSSLKQQQTIQDRWSKHARTGKCFVRSLVTVQRRGGGSHSKTKQKPEPRKF